MLTLSVAWKRTILCSFFFCTFVLAGCSRQKLFDFFSSKKHTTSKEHVHPQGALPVWHGACPCLAIVLDDLGSDLAAADEIFALNYPLTISVLPHHPHFYVAKRFEQMVKVLKRRKKASFEKVKV